MISLQPGLYLRIEPLDGPRAPQPQPLASGFSLGTAYLALGVYSPSETSEAYIVMANDRDEMWFVSNRHLRVAGLQPARTDLRVPLAALGAPATPLLPAHAGDGGQAQPPQPSTAGPA